jgi:hypothetical protein
VVAVHPAPMDMVDAQASHMLEVMGIIGMEA